MHSIKDIVKQLIGKSLDAYNTKYTKVLNTRIDNIVAQAGNDNTEIVDARIDSAGVTHTTLNNRILAETKMNDEQLVEYTGSNISAEDTTQGYLKDVEILGNTIQNEEDLSDIKSVGELQEDGTYKMSISSCGKNLINNSKVEKGFYVQENNSNVISNNGFTTSNYIKIKPNTKYVLNKLISYKAFYDRNKNIIPVNPTYDVNTFTTPTNASYVRISVSNANDITTYQLEEGTQVTTYEPYQGNKCDILSPCQLEKVGDVSDRLYYDDVEKAWCIEKNIVKIPLYESVNKINGDWETLYFSKTLSFDKVKNASSYCISSLLNYNGQDISTEDTITQLCIFGHANNFECRIRLRKDEFPNITTNEDYIKWATENDFYILLQSASPQKIVLPLSTQITLNSFFGTTHVYMESGEVEGTIKCKIPKSIGATVQTLNNKTDILSDRIEAIEGLKSSQNMKYETDKGYLVCKETKNGVIDDLKIEGKTLMNRFIFDRGSSDVDKVEIVCKDYKALSYGKFTILNLSDKNIGINIYNKDTDSFIRSISIQPNSSVVVDLDKENAYLFNVYGYKNVGWTDYEALKPITMFLEGDHTQNPPSYFEGLMSVGQDVDEIEVLSVNENLIEFDSAFTSRVDSWDTANLSSNVTHHVSLNSNLCKVTIENNSNYHFLAFKTIIRKGVSYSYKFDSTSNLGTSVSLFKDLSSTRGQTVASDFSGTFVANDNYNYIAIPINREVNTYSVSNFILTKDTQVTEYIPHQSDKKQILFYNSNGELEPIQELHEWDSIEKHSDNKWYYHKRSGKVVLNGSENWGLPTLEAGQVDTNWETETHIAFRTTGLINPKEVFWGHQQTCICNRFKVSILNNTTYTLSDEFIGQNSLGLDIKISKSKLSTQDVEGFKQWLQTNNVTVVYQLAQEEVYELAPLHLDSYANETLILCNSGAISPKMEFSITSHINELIKSQGERINLLEEKVYQYMVTQNRMQLASTYSTDNDIEEIISMIK